MHVPLLDLKPQYNSLKKELNEALLRVTESQYFILGPEVEQMEKELSAYLGCSYAIGVSSGTDALLLALMAMDIRPGDEVIVPAYSFFASAGVISRLNAIPVFIDIDPVTFNINPGEIEKKITRKTKAIIPVHLYGQSSEMDEVMRISAKYNIKVIEDAAQAIGTQYKDGKSAGAIGDAGCFSFFPSKNLGAFGDGGLITTNNEELASKMKILRVHGAEPKYYHKIIGGNFRIDAIQAAVIRVKLPHLDSWSDKRRTNAERYSKLLIDAGLSERTGEINFNDKNKVLLPKAVYKNSGLRNYHIYNQYIIRVKKRDELRKFLADNKIGTEIYYPVPFHLQECFSTLGYQKNDFPESEKAADTSVALPVFPELSKEQIGFVVEKIDEFIKKNG
ncbi:MAG TPA: DegT/DnrJ/EryC1/StrS family aminotransferase [Ignavibacteriaceae bacterium]|nr:DegT/DnrJ/EryC1/StrS family aminotransferase [Ignavibacteriaceae bacterium]